MQWKRIGKSLKAPHFAQAQAKLGCELPIEYRQFLSTQNGGIPKGRAVILGVSGKPIADLEQLFPLLEGMDPQKHPYGPDGAVTVCDEYARLRSNDDPLPEGLLPIGRTSVDQLVLLSTREPLKGHVYLVHENDLWNLTVTQKNSGDDSLLKEMEETYKVADGFNSFIEELSDIEEQDDTPKIVLAIIEADVEQVKQWLDAGGDPLATDPSIGMSVRNYAMMGYGGLAQSVQTANPGLITPEDHDKLRRLKEIVALFPPPKSNLNLKDFFR